ncbi:MAG TPA: hypothetical protein VLB46_00435 [Pyrinomonadaceae bacterium]|nr:hypothetical protein [Pyrinomonadaceae bacterium]
MLRKTLLVVCAALLWNSVTLAQTSNATARKFDEFGDIQPSDLIARLDNLAVMLSYEPGSKAFLIVYRTSRDLPGLSNRYAHRMRGYLVETRGLPSERIVIVDGGVASCLSQELWIVPAGSAPKPREDAYDNSYKPSVYKFDEHYYQMGNDPDEISYWPIPPANLIGYLEAFGETLLKDRKLVGYLIAFRDAARDNRQTTKRMLRTERNFLIRKFRIEPWRLKTVDGGYQPSRTMELWIAQPGYQPIVTSYRMGRLRRKH